MSNPYESERLLREYLLFHYGGVEDVLDGLPGPREAVGFAQRSVRELLGEGPVGRALDVGCAVGGASFELSKVCGEVVGVDYSANFIEAARRLATEGRLASKVAVEGSRTQPFCAVVDAAAHRERVRFEVGDAMALPQNLGNFDIVLAANLICRLPTPRKFLECLAGLVRPGGQLLLTTPFTWLEDYTPREHWLGGDRPSWDELREVLDCAFTLELRKDLPFLLREHARKFQYTVAVGSRWRRRS